MEFDDEDLGVEDLEQHEVLEALSKYQALAAALSTTGPAGLPLGWKRVAADEQGQYQVREFKITASCQQAYSTSRLPTVAAPFDFASSLPTSAQHHILVGC